MMKLNVHVFDHAPFMVEVAHLLEDILGRPVYEIEDWRLLISEAREVLKRGRDENNAA
jgi:hypothetical protein